MHFREHDIRHPVTQPSAQPFHKAAPETVLFRRTQPVQGLLTLNPSALLALF